MQANINTRSFIQQQLFDLQDEEYKAFHSKLMPTIHPDVIIGVRTPALRKLAKTLLKTNATDIREFMSVLPHTYYEENNLHAFCIEGIRDYDECIRALDLFLPFVDNWATCDCMVPKILAKYPEHLLPQINKWLDSEHTYTVRYAMGLLMRYFLDEQFKEEYLALVAGVESEEYYINMMRAWYFATALAKQYDTTLPWLIENRLDIWTHNKTIQKAVESYRITKEQKDYLKTLKRK
ncbi:MAG: DNA alkylation repair protein [Lachnospiraceae bacterium]|nr:DNA alkylation repair protein [Lachnospiraceae bacterium]